LHRLSSPGLRRESSKAFRVSPRARSLRSASFVSTPGNAKKSIEKALSRAIPEMLEDKALQQTLLRR
jgi:hypothetical protein